MNTHWTQGLFYSFDLESSSPDPLEAHVVSGTVVKIQNGQYSDKRAWLIKPAVEVPQGAIDVHGLTNEYLAENGQDAATALEEILTTLASVLNAGVPLVVFNAAYDLTVMERQAEYYGLRSLRSRVNEAGWRCVIDPLIIAKGLEHYWRHEYVKGRNFKLPSLCERYGVDFVESHDATADALGAGLLAAALMREDRLLMEKGPRALYDLQASWRQRSMESLQQYFRKIEHEDAESIDFGWPLHSSLMGA